NGPVVTGRGREWWPTRRGVSRRIHRWIGHILQIRIDRHASRGMGNTSRLQIEVVDLGYTTRTVHSHVRRKPALLAFRPGAHHHPLPGALDATYLSGEFPLPPQVAGPPDQQIDEVWIEALQGTHTAMHHGDVPPRSHGEMGKLKRDIPASDKHQA